MTLAIELDVRKKGSHAPQNRLDITNCQRRLHPPFAKKVGWSNLRAMSEQIANNAAVANENAVKEMTRRGGCGYEPGYRDPNSGMLIAPRVKECTVDDLKR